MCTNTKGAVFIFLALLSLFPAAIWGQSKYATQSVLSAGDWHKLGLKETGIYKITYSELSALGIDVDAIDPRDIRIYHNGGGVLPELNKDARYDDLKEIPIYVAGESDGKFNRDDYILFYGRGPVCWQYKQKQQTYDCYEHVQNYYDDYAYAFLTTGLGRGRRMANANAPTGAATETVEEFLDYKVHESDESNLNNMGRSYYGDFMDGNISKDFDFDFPNIITSRQCVLHVELAGRNFNPASFEVLVDGNHHASYSISATTSTGHAYAVPVSGYMKVYPAQDKVKVTLNHVSSSTNSTSVGYVDYILVNAWRHLKFSGKQMLFRNPEKDNINKVYAYRVSNASQQMQVWDVTDPVESKAVPGQLNGSVFSFNTNGSPDNEFIAFDGTSFLSTVDFGSVANQNLHALRNVDYLIITHPDFMSQAERVKAIHEVQDPEMVTYITTPQQIYNEFGCGAMDVSAIRDFCRMLYLDSDRKLKYLLLFGDASFDYKNRAGKVCFVPSFESMASLNINTCYVTDDYFGCFDVTEGDIDQSLADIGIGRMPVSTLEQAVQMVDKIENYLALNETTMQPWRNVVAFVADDDTQEFVNNPEEFEQRIKTSGGADFVFDKIYLGAYEQVPTPNGVLAPAVNEAINNRIEKGALVMNYIGHGGEVQLSEERILQRKDVDSWHNGPMYPVMITGTCEVSRYDDHNRTSIGEYAFLNQYGGMIAMFTTSRVTGGGDNAAFTKGIYNHLFELTDGKFACFGDVYRMAKSTGRKEEKRYVLFGDPALRITAPKWKVETESINEQRPEIWQDSILISDSLWQYFPVYSDTISALQPVEIKGYVKDYDGQLATGFNGKVYVTVYDKESDLVAKCENSSTVGFKLRNSIIFKGETVVENGRFSISFTVPRDIAYSYGTGMVSYYATNYEIDANGKCESFIVGGFYEDAVLDEMPPEIELHIDDIYFVSGSIVGENPTLIAFVEDESGINTTGAGIGHDIIATLTGAADLSYNLNDCFVSETGNSGKGTITYKMLNLPDGDYTLTLKVWDIYNNSNTASIDFTVTNSAEMLIENPYNVPNPVTDGTGFVFEHNQIGNNMDVQIYIYDMMGRLVDRISEQVAGTSTRVEPIRWNACTSNGAPLANGIYIYRIVATNDKGETQAVSSKLVISK